MFLEIINKIKNIVWLQAVKAGTLEDSLDKIKPKNVPQEENVFELIGGFINFFMELIGFFLLVVILYAAIQMMTANGEEDKIKNSKQMLMYAVLGVILVALSLSLTNWLLVGSPFDSSI